MSTDELTRSRIKLFRTKQGMTQQQLAAKVKTTYQNISQYERGIRIPKMNALRKIAAALGVDVWELVGTDNYIPTEGGEHMKPCDDDLNRAIGQQLRGLRQAKGLTLNELSNLVSIPLPTISEWERGIHSPSISGLISLANFFEVSIHDLIDGIAAQPSGSTTDRAITLAELFRVLDAKHAAIVLTISPAVKARIDLDFSNTDQIEDVTREDGDCPISLFQLRSINDNGFAVIVIDHKPRTD